MDTARWQRVEALFHAALERPAAARAAFLADACAGDTSLHSDVARLLAEHDADPDFLAIPLVDVTRVAASVAPSAVERIGAYRLVRALGEGGMGTVYLGVQEGEGFERPVAIKVIRGGMVTAEVLRRFQLERRILAALRHPNIAHLLDAGSTGDGRPYFVMEFIEGEPIDAWCERHQLGVHERLKLFLTVCGAVQHAHGNLVVHRDLKPGNIIVSSEGVPHLLDFGIGKLLDPLELAGDAAATRADVRMFTPEFASPEQVRGEPVSVATDVFGLGMLLYRLLTGKHPFTEATTPQQYEHAVVTTDPRRPSTFGGRRLRGDLDTIVLKALRKEPQRRYSSAGALADDIQRYLDGMPVRARADVFAYRASKFVRRHRLPLAAAAVVFLSLAFATAYSTRQARAVAQERDKALEVQGFLLEMFGASGRQQTDTLSVHGLLHAQRAALEDAYPDAPEVRAQMKTVLAEGYDRLGLFAEAEQLAREALDLRRSVLDSDHPDVAASLGLLGWIQFERGNAQDGEALLRDAVAQWKSARPFNEAAYARTLNDLGVVREAAGDYQEAAALYREALVLRRRLFGDTHRAVAVTANNLSTTLYRQGDYRAAVAVGEEALRAMRRTAGPDHQRPLIIQHNLATMKAALGDTDGARAEFEDVVERQTRVLGRQHPQTAGTLLALSAVLRNQRNYELAEQRALEALQILEATLGPAHARVAVALAQLGAARSGLGRYAEARTHLDSALVMLRKQYGDAHASIAQALTLRAQLQTDMKDHAAAEQTHRQVLAMWEKMQGAQHPETAKARAQLARVLLARGDSATAYDLYRNALEAMLAAGLPASNPLVATTQATLDSVRAVLTSGRPR